MPPKNPHESTDRVIVKLNRALAESLRTLIETKHLYQRVKVDLVGIAGDASGAIPERLYNQNIVVADVSFETLDSTGSSNTLILGVGNVKTFCTKCDSREVAAPVWCRNLNSEIEQPQFVTGGPQGWPRTAADQVFVLAYQCQRCLGEYDVYTVRWANWQMSLDGRSPMEHIATPNYVPKRERNLFRDALIASHGGKTLAALFYLRCFIEQFARRQTGMTGKATGDVIMAAYAATLPPAQRDLMPSLKQQYDSLSEAIHAVREDAELFERSRKDVEKHFEIRRVFEIPDYVPTHQA